MHRDDNAFVFSAKSPPPVGYSFINLDGQRFTVTGCKPYERMDYQKSLVISWSSRCKTCGDPYTLTTGTAAILRRLKLRCDACKHTADNREQRNAAYGVQQRKSFALARDVKAGKVPLEPKALIGVSLNETGTTLRCVFAFNDRVKRTAVYRPQSNEIRCGQAREADFSPFVSVVAQLYDQELAKTLF